MQKVDLTTILIKVTSLQISNRLVAQYPLPITCMLVLMKLTSRTLYIDSSSLFSTPCQLEDMLK